MSAEAEPRRSVRSTKGQHKSLDQLDQAMEPKRRGRKKKSEKQEEPEVEIIRCICGATEPEEEESQPWIACDKCKAWQHNVCMGQSIFGEDLTNSEYFCEICRPEDHKELLEAMSRGEKPWETRRKAYLEEQAEGKKKKKGKGSKGKRVSDPSGKEKETAAPASEPPASSVPPEPSPADALSPPAPATTAANGKKASPAPPAATTSGGRGTTASESTPNAKKDAKKDTKKDAAANTAKTGTGAAGGAGTKRKSRGASEDKEQKGTQKMRKVSESQGVPISSPTDGAAAGAGATSPTTMAAPTLIVAEPALPPKPVEYDPPEDLPASIPELLDTRQGPAKALKKNITAALTALEKKGKSLPKDGATVAQRAERFAIQIERAVQDTHANPKEYGAQVKTLAFNLKNNPDLVMGLIEQTISPPMLAVMTTDQLASKELQRETAEMKARAEKQSILITDDGPRMRKTHKGEEMVENEPSSAVDESTPAVSRHMMRDSVSGPAGPNDGNNASEEAGEGGDHDDPMDVEVELPADLEYQQRPQASSSTASSRTAKDRLRIDPAHHASKTDFDIKKVFSKVRSPTQPLRRISHPAPQSKGPGDDPEVDRLLQDGNESPPYSPTEETDPDIIWRGNLEMPNVGSLQVTSKFMGGGNVSKALNIPWSQIFPQRILIDGRLPQQATTVYLCGMRWRPAYDVVVVSLSPAHEASKPQFQKVVDYFVSRERYGVVDHKGVRGIRDAYLMPLVPGGEVPEIMLNLSDNFVPENRTDPALLLAIVYEHEGAKSQAQEQQLQQQLQQQHTSAHQTPAPARHPSISAPAFSPHTPQGAFPSAFPPHQGNGQGHAYGQPQHQPQQAGPAFAQPPLPYSVQDPYRAQHPQPPAGAIGHQPNNAHCGSNNANGNAAAAAATATGGAQAQGAQGNASAIENAAAAREKAQNDGIAYATSMLGPFINCPSVQFLIPQSQVMRAEEWQVVRSLLEKHPLARDDITELAKLLETSDRSHQQQTGGHPPPPPPPPSTAGAGGPRQAQAQHPPPVAQAPALAAAPAPAPGHAHAPAPVAAASQTLVSHPHPPPRPMPMSQTPIPIPHVPHTLSANAKSPPVRSAQPATAPAAGSPPSASGDPGQAPAPASAPTAGS